MNVLLCIVTSLPKSTNNALAACGQMGQREMTQVKWWMWDLDGYYVSSTILTLLSLALMLDVQVTNLDRIELCRSIMAFL